MAARVVSVIDERYWALRSSTLGELRRVLGECDGLPDDASVLTGEDGASWGMSPLRRVTVLAVVLKSLGVPDVVVP